ncbi:3,4-dihydroxyphenylacetate 2,3-dioxygenase [Numidum massiliense]|uniref:3,4-dihydroxyphenylacetate 2,3-dioxygenase n=1 Tax=Numidum massiliense TaxID=1522315 RepID=UPI000ADBCED8|nr:3,4-dihydroxyphenylacetate 2,3-dioxygenase [Numidum massiliense]
MPREGKGVPGDDMRILRSAFAELHVTDLARSRHFYVDMLGLIVSGETKTQLYLRGVEERVHHSLVLTEAPRAAVGRLGFRVARANDLEHLYDFYAKCGCKPRYVETGRMRGQGLSVDVQDPFGFPLTFFADMDAAPSYMQQYHLHRGAAVRRIDHFNCFVPQLAAAYRFWHDELGFRLSEYVETDDEPREKVAVWLFRKPSVHDLALMQGDGPRVHHIGFWMDDVNSIIRACDILGAAEMHEAIERGPGRHGISNAFFLYLRDPDGHRIELYTSDYLTLDPDFQPIRWSATDPRRQTLWGHRTPDSWWREASPVARLDDDALVTPQTAAAVDGIERHIK